MIETLIRTHVEAFNTHDLETLMAGFTDDAVWVTGTTTTQGRAELTELFARALEGLLPTLTIQNLIVGDDRAACQMVETFTVDGAERTDHIAGFYAVANGRIASAKIYREGSADVG
ncbi:nuclear transport factor 2 family protein [Streptomyces sp. NPDC051322]|uniref:nuclear transport factor 2 family protein n=1 Tax=Streptomyces sp. NPDC051322 TaxID=3154645 RepID=UPI003450AEFF